MHNAISSAAAHQNYHCGDGNATHSTSDFIKSRFSMNERERQEPLCIQIHRISTALPAIDRECVFRQPSENVCVLECRSRPRSQFWRVNGVFAWRSSKKRRHNLRVRDDGGSRNFWMRRRIFDQSGAGGCHCGYASSGFSNGASQQDCEFQRQSR